MIYLLRINNSRHPKLASRRLRETDLKALFCTLSCLALALYGQSAGGEPEPGLEPIPLEPVVVVSSRSARPVSEVVGMVAVLDDADIDARMATDPEGLWRYTPGVQVESSGDRFAGRSLNIRGVGGNRIVMEVDGIPVQERFAVGAFAFAGRSGADLDFIRRIEVLRGPASSLYGSRAIGGVIAISTFDPDDLAEPGSPGGVVRGSYAGDWDGVGASAISAWQGERLGLLLGGSARRGNEPDHSASPANPDRIDRDRGAMLAKATLSAGADARIRVTLEADRDETESELNSLLGQGRFANTTRLSGDDRVTRTGLAVDGQTRASGLDLEGAAFYRETRTRQDTVDLRENLARPIQVEREFSYDTTVRGARAKASREFETGAVRHRLLLGADYARSELDESRDALQTGLTDGLSTRVVLGERFPLRDFPVSVSQESGIYLQDEIDSAGGRWTLIPSIRYDRTRLRVEDDEEWRRANPTAELAELTASNVSPRLGALWRFSPELQAWGQVASGFRAPPAEDLNIGLDIPMFNARALPNPELDSESSLGWELGVRAGARGAWLSAAAFWTDYDDFIVSMVPLGPDPDTGTLLFQSQNVERVRIRGFELEAGAPLGLVTPMLDAFALGFSGYWAEGENRRTGAALYEVGPATGVLHLDWASPSGRWDARLSGLFAPGKHRDDAVPVPLQGAPGHGVLDLLAAWRPASGLTIRAGVFNLGDKTWWRWGDVRRLPAGDPLVPHRSAPGRSLSLSFHLDLGPGRT
jgi:hemoglobin/transferrin/lactoferrin receptor protein